MTGRLVLAGTPIGDFSDASARLRKVLGEADVVAAEDTRRLKRLTSELGIVVTGRVVSFFEGNERERTPMSWSGRLLEGQTVVVVTDAGMPSVSDPGYRLVAAAIEAGIRVTAVPGPSAVLTALALSGLAGGPVHVRGVPAAEVGGAVEAVRRARPGAADDDLLRGAAPAGRLAQGSWPTALGKDRRTAVCRELTKTYEEVKRGTAAELAEWAADGRPRRDHHRRRRRGPVRPRARPRGAGRRGRSRRGSRYAPQAGDLRRSQTVRRTETDRVRRSTGCPALAKSA